MSRFISKEAPGMTWPELVRCYFPGATNSEVEIIMWELTAFPASSARHIEKQIRRFYFKLKRAGITGPPWLRPIRYEQDRVMKQMMRILKRNSEPPDHE